MVRLDNFLTKNDFLLKMFLKYYIFKKKGTFFIKIKLFDYFESQYEVNFENFTLKKFHSNTPLMKEKRIKWKKYK